MSTVCTLIGCSENASLWFFCPQTSYTPTLIIPENGFQINRFNRYTKWLILEASNSKTHRVNQQHRVWGKAHTTVRVQISATASLLLETGHHYSAGASICHSIPAPRDRPPVWLLQASKQLNETDQLIDGALLSYFHWFKWILCTCMEMCSINMNNCYVSITN